jgi:hypothetical protein
MKLNITNIDRNCLSSDGVSIALTYFLTPPHARACMRQFPIETGANSTSLFPQPAPPLNTKKSANAPPRMTPTGDAQIGITTPDRKVAVESGSCRCPAPAPTQTPPEIRTRDPSRQIAHPDLLTDFGDSTKSKQSHQ